MYGAGLIVIFKGKDIRFDTEAGWELGVVKERKAR